MGMDYGASRYDIINEAIIAQTCQKELSAFHKAIEDVVDLSDGIGTEAVFDAFAEQAKWKGTHTDTDYGILGKRSPDGDQDYLSFVKVEKAYKKLQRAFEKKTGLHLHCAHVGEGLRG